MNTEKTFPFCPFFQTMYTFPNMMRTDPIEYDNTIEENSPFNTNLDSEAYNSDNIMSQDIDSFEDNSNNIKRNTEDDITEDNITEELTPPSDEDTENLFRSPVTVNEILKRIELNNPTEIRRLVSYGIPYHIAIRIIRRIIYLTLSYQR